MPSTSSYNSPQPNQFGVNSGSRILIATSKIGSTIRKSGGDSGSIYTDRLQRTNFVNQNRGIIIPIEREKDDEIVIKKGLQIGFIESRFIGFKASVTRQGTLMMKRRNIYRGISSPRSQLGSRNTNFVQMGTPIEKIENIQSLLKRILAGWGEESLSRGVTSSSNDIKVQVQ